MTFTNRATIIIFILNPFVTIKGLKFVTVTEFTIFIIYFIVYFIYVILLNKLILLYAGEKTTDSTFKKFLVNIEMSLFLKLKQNWEINK